MGIRGRLFDGIQYSCHTHEEEEQTRVNLMARNVAGSDRIAHMRTTTILEPGPLTPLYLVRDLDRADPIALNNYCDDRSLETVRG